jgi:hypothetical protein
MGFGVWGIFLFNLFIFHLHPCTKARNSAVESGAVHDVAYIVAGIKLLTLPDAGYGM